MSHPAWSPGDRAHTARTAHTAGLPVGLPHSGSGCRAQGRSQRTAVDTARNAGWGEGRQGASQARDAFTHAEAGPRCSDGEAQGALLFYGPEDLGKEQACGRRGPGSRPVGTRPRCCLGEGGTAEQSALQGGKRRTPRPRGSPTCSGMSPGSSCALNPWAFLTTGPQGPVQDPRTCRLRGCTTNDMLEPLGKSACASRTSRREGEDGGKGAGLLRAAWGGPRAGHAHGRTEDRAAWLPRPGCSRAGGCSPSACG